MQKNTVPLGLVWRNLVLISFLASACDTRTLRYSAFEDLVVGSTTVKLYTNGECAMEMGLGYHAGHYVVRGDTIRITYQEKALLGIPTQLRITPDFLITLPTADYPHATRIRRQ